MTRIHWEKEDRLELDKSFAKNPHPDAAEKERIAEKLQVPLEKVHNFFKNKRQKLRRSGVPIKRVIYEDSTAKSKRSTQKILQSAPKDSQGQIVKNESCSPVIKQERNDDPDYQPDTTFSTTADESIYVANDSNQRFEKTPEITPINPMHNSSFNSNPPGPNSSLVPFTPIGYQPARFTSSTPIIPTYLPIQSPYLQSVPSCFDSTAIQYFPIHEKSTKVAASADPIAHEKDLDQILEDNLNHLNESEDTGIEDTGPAEDTGFEILSEPEPEIEIRPLPNWFPFSVLYPNQPIIPNHQSLHFNRTNPAYYTSIYQNYFPF